MTSSLPPPWEIRASLNGPFFFNSATQATHREMCGYSISDSGDGYYFYTDAGESLWALPPEVIAHMAASASASPATPALSIAPTTAGPPSTVTSLALPCSIMGAWHGGTLDAVAAMPQYRLLLSQAGVLKLTLRQPAGSVYAKLVVTPLGQGFRAERVGSPDTTATTAANAIGTVPGSESDAFSNKRERAITVSLEAHVEYAVLLAQCEADERGDFTLELAQGELAGIGGARLAAPVTELPLISLSAGKAAAAAEAAATAAAAEASAASVAAAEEAARRARALAAMQAAATAAPEGSPSRDSWADMCAASEEVKLLRASLLARGVPFCDARTEATLGTSAFSASAIEWRRAVDIAPHPALIVDGFSMHDVEQGGIGTCYLISSIAVLAGDPSRHRTLDTTPLDALFVTNALNSEGVVCVRFWADNRWQRIVMDDRLPCLRGTYRRKGSGSVYRGLPDTAEGKWPVLAGASSTCINELWPALLEKAWALFSGGYSEIVSGVAADTLPYLVPHSMNAGSVDLDPCMQDALSDDSLWSNLTDWLASGHFVCASSPQQLSGDQTIRNGIICKHAYSLFRASEHRGVRLLQLRNPHGGGEWMGAYSDNDAQSWTEDLKQAIGYDPMRSGDDGVFWMPLLEFRSHFARVDSVHAVRLANDGGSWHKKTACGEWRKESVIRSPYYQRELVPYPQVRVGEDDA